jgi:hypothetical protein
VIYAFDLVLLLSILQAFHDIPEMRGRRLLIIDNTFSEVEVVAAASNVEARLGSFESFLDFCCVCYQNAVWCI